MVSGGNYRVQNAFFQQLLLGLLKHCKSNLEYVCGMFFAFGITLYVARMSTFGGIISAVDERSAEVHVRSYRI